MSDNINIVVREQGSEAAANGMRTIASSSLKAAQNVDALNKSLKGLKVGTSVVNDMQKMLAIANKVIASNTGLAASQVKLAQAGAKLAEADARVALGRARVATETQRTQKAMADAEAAIMRAIAASTKSATADQLLAAAKIKVQQETARLSSAQVKAAADVQRLTEATAKAATAQQKLTTEQQRTVEAMTRASIAAQALVTAQTNAIIATTRLGTEQQRLAAAATQAQIQEQNLAAATARAQSASTGAATAAQRLAAEQQRVRTAAANAAAAQDRAAITALRLAEAQRRVGESSRTASNNMLDFVRNAAAAAGLSVGVMSLGKMADGYTTLQNKLVNLAPDMVTTNKLMNEMFELANRTRQPVESTTQAFQRFDNAMKDMGGSQEETLRMTETVNKAIIVSGASASESASGLLQLAQAFGSGRLQGDEFRSIMENMPVLADMIAKSMGRTRSELKVLSTQGLITSAVMRKAFAEAAEEIDAKFAKTVPTMGQAFNVLRNNVMRAVGQLDQSLGVTRAISMGMIDLSNNLGTASLAAVILGGALMTAYGPGLVATLNKAKVAVLAFNTALKANPVGLVITALAALATAVYVYGDKMKVAGSETVTFKDVAVGVFDLVGDGFSAMGTGIKSMWNKAIDAVNEKTGGFGEKFRDLGAYISEVLKANANSFIGVWVGSYDAITLLWKKFPTIMGDVFAKVANLAAGAAETVVNSWQTSLRLVAKGMESVAPDMVASLNKALDGLKIELPRMEVGPELGNAIDEVGAQFKAALNVDYVGKTADVIMGAAEKASKARIAAADAEAAATLRAQGAGANKPAEAGKAELKRAAALAKVNLELSNELERMNMLKPARDDQARFDAIEEKMVGKKIKLTADEAAVIRAKIAAIRTGIEVQAAMDKIYEDSVAPLRDYNNQIAAANMLLEKGAISTQDYQKALVGAAQAYQQAVNPLYAYNKAMSEQKALNAFNPRDRELEAELLGVQNQLLGQNVILTDSQTAALRANIEAQQRSNELTAARDAIYASTTGAVDEVTTKQLALNQAYADGTITQTYYTAQMAQANMQMATLQNMMGDGTAVSVFTEGVGQAIAGFTSLASSAATIVGNMMTSAVDGFSNAIAGAIVKGEDLQDTLSQVATSIVTEMLSALIKMGVQYLLNAAMATTAQQTATAASVAAAATTATAWAPAAAAVSLASWGANAGPAVLGISAANVAAQSFALAGFKKGGYTGDAAVNQAAGIVHGQEFVVTAEATKKYRSTLEAMNNGSFTENGTGVTNLSNDTQAGQGRVTMVSFDFVQHIEVVGSKNDTMEDNLETAAEAISQKTQADIMDSIRTGGVWSKII